MRDFDFVMGAKDVLVALAGLCADLYSSLPYTVVGGLVATQTTVASLNVNMGAGRIYQFAMADAIADGSIPQDTNIIVQQGYAAAQTITLIGPSAGQSQWNLIQAQFSQVDSVRTGDPNSGNVPFYNPANPTQPTTNSINTVRKAVCVLQVVTGSAATTGSETPPLPTSGWVPLYLIDLAGGQTAVTTGQMLPAGPSVGTGVSTSYPYAPFVAGLLASHHSGNAGQAPKIKLGSEVQGVLPYANMSPVRTFLTGNLTLYVATTGSNLNSGITPSVPLLTIQAAVNAVYHNYDFAGFGVTISVANGTYSGGAACVGVPPGMPGAIAFVGNVASPSLVIINATNGNDFSAIQGASINVSGFTIGASGVAGAYTVVGYGLVAGTGGSVVFGAITFGGCTNAHLLAFGGGNVSSNGAAYAIMGSSSFHMTGNGGTITTTSSAVTITGTPAFSAFAAAIDGGLCSVQLMTFTGAATGSRFAVSTGAVINTNTGNTSYLPGSAAGTGTNYGAAPWGLYL